MNDLATWKALSKACLLLCTTDSKYFRTESEPLPLCRAPWAAWSPMVSLPCCQGSPCWASREPTHCLSEEHPIQELQFVPGLDSPHKGAQGGPREGNEQQKPRSLANTLPGAFCYSMLSSGNRLTDTGPHKRNMFQ